MAKSVKLKFDRESEFSAKAIVICDKLLGDGLDRREYKTITYEKNGKVIVSSEGFEHIVTSVDELVVKISPLDDFFSKVTFEVTKIDSKAKLPLSMFGVRGFNILIDYKNEISGSEELPDDN
jgi:hypothetical protein